MKYKGIDIKMRKGLFAFKHLLRGREIKGEARTIKGITRKINKELRK